MVAPGFLENPEVRRWLNGVEPAWTMLEFNSLNALRHEPSASNHAIRLEPDLADAEISGSAVTANALILLRRAADTGGLKLTATGNLSRAVVEEMFGIIKAPDYDKAELLSVQKVINDPPSCSHVARTLAHEPCLFRRIPARLVAPERSGGHPVVAFSIGTRLAAERDAHAALRVSRDRRSGVAMGLWFQCHGGSHSPTLGLVRTFGITNPSEVDDRVGWHPSIPKSTTVRSLR